VPRGGCSHAFGLLWPSVDGGTRMCYVCAVSAVVVDGQVGAAVAHLDEPVPQGVQGACVWGLVALSSIIGGSILVSHFVSCSWSLLSSFLERRGCGCDVR
jgi:hypothetical protein